MQAADIYYRVIREVATDLECILLPLHLYMINYMYINKLSYNEIVLKDTRLLSSKGHMIVADFLSQKIKVLTGNEF